MNHERWIWTELIGFDTRQPDLGVREYLDTAGFVPAAVCLLLSHVDFVLQHAGMATEIELPKDICSREGHEHNQTRTRQAWSNWQVRSLIEQLHAHGIEVYLTVFAQCFDNRWHQEWAMEHPEVRTLHPRIGHRGDINPLTHLRDGTWYEDFFCAKLVQAVTDYGFDGWHGADEYGPLSEPLYDCDFDDDMVAQFLAARPVTLPAGIPARCGDDYVQHVRRADAIWRDLRQEWIEFYADRWAAFWRKLVTALHAHGRKAVINSSWGRAPFESLYRYGIDYRKIVDTGVDAIVVETVAAALTLDARCGDAARHFDFLSMLMLIRAYVPDTKLIFLHNVQDVVEQWDAIHHGPAILEKEIYSLANVFLTDQDGQFRRSADGFLVCLGDGIVATEWQWLEKRWQAAFGPMPAQVHGATLVWSDAAMHNQIPEFTRTRSWFTHRLLYHLMERGAPVQSVVRIDAMAGARGPLLLLNFHLFPKVEQDAVLAYRHGPLVFVGPEHETLPAGDLAFTDLYSPGALCCRGCGLTGQGAPHLETDGPDDRLAATITAVDEPHGLWLHFPCRHVSASFLQGCANLILATAGVRIVADADAVTLMLAEQGDGTLHVALKNKRHTYAKPRLDFGRPLRALRVRSEFPIITLRPEGTTFAVKVPPGGIVVVEVEFAG